MTEQTKKIIDITRPDDRQTDWSACGRLPSELRIIF